MKRNGLIFLLVALLILPVFAISFTACAEKKVKVDDDAAAKAAAEAAAKAAAEKAAREAALAQYNQAKDVFQNDHVYFDFDRYNIRKDQEAKLRFKADFLTANAKVAAEVQGHCDERGTNAYNMALGDRRAHSAKTFLEPRCLAGRRISAVSYGFIRSVLRGHGEGY
ncbi:MAG: OmpA family protein [Deltaproteobacteria bacterium]|nr:OmpA family protein [Deltaproteobacteria bacterium]